MKKLIALLLSACLLVSMCGCTLIDSFMEGFKQGFEEGISQDDSGVSTDDSEVEPTKAPKKSKEFSLGTYSGKTYENDYVGIGFQLPDSWRYYTDEEMNALNQVSTELVGDEYAKLLETKDLAYAMMASSSADMENVYITLEKSNVVQGMVDMKTIYQNSMPLTTKSLENAGATNVKCELGTIVFDGKVVDAMYVSSEMAGFHLQQLAVMRKTGNHIATIGITTTDKDRLQEILDMFYELD